MKFNRIGFENFRVLKNKSIFELAPITVLTGANSSGKSTVIKGLKLFQNLWVKPGFKHKLEFEKGKHQLGDFEMALSKNSDNKELTVTFEFDHIVFGTLTVTLIYVLDESNTLKNGQLKRARIHKGKVIIFGITIEKDSQFYGYNYKYILETLYPLLKREVSKLKPEFEKFNEILSGAAESKTYETGLTLQIIDSSDSSFKKLNIDKERYWDLHNLFVFDFSKKHNEQGSLPDLSKPYPPYIYDLEILRIFSKIEKSNVMYFVDEVWNKLTMMYPRIERRYNYLSFKKYIENLDNEGVLHINLWKESFMISEEPSFDLFLKKQIDLSHEIISKKAGSSALDIDDIEEMLHFPFYKPARVAKEILWTNFYNSSQNTTSPTAHDKAVVNCFQIISDALYLEKNLLGKEVKNDELTILPVFERFFTNLYKDIEHQFSQMYFIDSIRATSQRLYTTGASADSFNDFIFNFLKCNFKEKEMSFVNKWLQEYEIADKFEIELIRGIGSEVYIIKGSEKINLVDMGYGVTQFLPILMKIIYCNNIGKRKIVIEEPETNLHPKFQSKLADLFVDAYHTFNIEFIIETHSEYFIRKLQFLTAKGDIETKDTVLYYLANSDDKKRGVGEEQLRRITIQSNGRLSKPFGTGFYDEADNLSLEMMQFSLN